MARTADRNDPAGSRLRSQFRLQIASMLSAIRCPYFQKAFGWCNPIGGLAGLVGLGGGEFRLPVLMYVVGYPVRTAVPLNLAVSLITLTFALVVRSRAVSVAALVPYLNEVAGLAVGGVASAFYGARVVSAIKSEHLIIGAALGGMAVGFAPVAAINAVLGFVLIAAAAKVAVSKH
jgi:uncharacterized membrane protein YfcA